jgi:hypothetical protein
MASPLEILRFSLIAEETGRVFPVKNIADPTAKSEHVKLGVGENKSLPEIDLDQVFDLPLESDFNVSLRIETNLPQFGDLPALPNGYNGMRVKNGRFSPLN